MNYLAYSDCDAKDLLLYDDYDTTFATLLANTFLLCYVLYNEETDGCNADVQCSISAARVSRTLAWRNYLVPATSPTTDTKHGLKSSMNSVLNLRKTPQSKLRQ